MHLQIARGCEHDLAEPLFGLFKRLSVCLHRERAIAFNVCFHADGGIFKVTIADDGTASLLHDKIGAVDIGSPVHFTGALTLDLLPKGKGIARALGSHLHLADGAVVVEKDLLNAQPAVGTAIP